MYASGIISLGQNISIHGLNRKNTGRHAATVTCNMHKECVPNFPKCASGFQGLVAVCPLCSCALTDEGGLRTELWEAVDYIFQTASSRKMRNGSEM